MGLETCPSCGLEFRESAFLGLPEPIPSTDASRRNVSQRFRSDDLDRCDRGASQLTGQREVSGAVPNC